MNKVIKINYDTSCTDDYEPSFSVLETYCDKSKPKYRAFKSKEECLKTLMSKIPNDWITNISDKSEISKILSMDDTGVVLADYDSGSGTFMWPYKSAFGNFQFIDGQPFGIIDLDI